MLMAVFVGVSSVGAFQNTDLSSLQMVVVVFLHSHYATTEHTVPRNSFLESQPQQRLPVKIKCVPELNIYVHFFISNLAKAYVIFCLYIDDFDSDWYCRQKRVTSAEFNLA